jgi:hypothetical protein
VRETEAGGGLGELVREVGEVLATAVRDEEEGSVDMLEELRNHVAPEIGPIATTLADPAVVGSNG